MKATRTWHEVTHIQLTPLLHLHGYHFIAILPPPVYGFTHLGMAYVQVATWLWRKAGTHLQRDIESENSSFLSLPFCKHMQEMAEVVADLKQLNTSLGELLIAPSSHPDNLGALARSNQFLANATLCTKEFAR